MAFFGRVLRDNAGLFPVKPLDFVYERWLYRGVFKVDAVPAGLAFAILDEQPRSFAGVRRCGGAGGLAGEDDGDFFFRRDGGDHFAVANVAVER